MNKLTVRKLTAQEQHRAMELFCIAFESPRDRNKPFKPDTDDHWAAFQGDAMVSALTVRPYRIRFDGAEYPMCGVGGVSSLPHIRRSGGIRGCFEAFLPDLYNKGVAFSYLYPFSTCFYRKFGYESCVQKYALTLDPSQLRPGEVLGSCRLLEGDSGSAPAIRAIDEAWEAKYNMFVLHTPEDSTWADRADPVYSGNYTYLYERPDGPAAYTEFHLENQPDGRNLVCSKFRFLDADGFRGLMTIFKALSADHRYVKLCLPAEPAMQYLMPEWSLGAARWEVLPAGMVRVVNAETVLKGARLHGQGSLTIAITDEQIPENNAVFRVDYAQGAPNTVTRTEAAPQITLSIPTFSALISGVAEFPEAALFMEGITLHDKSAPFEHIFYRKPLMIADYF